MSGGVEYNKIALNDVVTRLQNLLETEKCTVSVSTINSGLASEKISEIAGLYDTIDEKIRILIQETLNITRNVIEAVEEVDGV
ncbi:MAG: hypothetical protein HDT23_09110 [Ruminococcus sp.]|nr:hypothetical protein [Ruminococcus sp.]